MLLVRMVARGMVLHCSCTIHCCFALAVWQCTLMGNDFIVVVLHIAFLIDAGTSAVHLQ